MEDNEILKDILKYQDKKYQQFSSKLIPNIDPSTVIGVRIPALRLIAKKFYNTSQSKEFINSLPHKYLEENIVHSVLITMEKDPSQCLSDMNNFAPYIDNWSVCDTLRPKVLLKDVKNTYAMCTKWIKSSHSYTVRLGIGILLSYFLDDNFTEESMEMVSKVKSDDYYVKMMIAWYFATALAKQYDSALVYLTQNKLDKWVHNKTIQKAIESFRITPQTKEYLKTLKVKS